MNSDLVDHVHNADERASNRPGGSIEWVRVMNPRDDELGTSTS